MMHSQRTRLSFSIPYFSQNHQDSSSEKVYIILDHRVILQENFERRFQKILRTTSRMFMQQLYSTRGSKNMDF